MSENPTHFTLNPPAVSLYAEQMMLRLLLEHKLPRCFLNSSNWDNDITQPLGLPDELEDHPAQQRIARKLLSARWQQIKNLPAQDPDFALAYRNIAFLARRLGLSEAEQTMLRFAVHMNREDALRETARLFRVDFNIVCRFISDLCGASRHSVRAALHKNRSKLYQYGLLNRYINRSSTLDDFAEWGDTFDLDDFSNQSATEQDWLRTCAHSTQPPTLQWSDFAHLGEMRDIMQRYLGQPEKRAGINILIYGRPGCGKTEFAALLAQQTELPCYTLVAQDEDGETIAPKTRLHKCRLAHTMLEHTPSLLIFDEIEDVFGSGLFERSTADIHKPWINQILEHNPVPTVWLSNNAHCMDEAFLRRFDLVLEMPDLPRAQKAALIRKLGGDMLDEDHIQHFAKQENLLPALLERSFKVAKAVRQPENNLGDTARRILNQTLLAQGYPSIGKPPAAQAPYSLQWLNCDADIAAVSHGIVCHPHARICCYGAPGTGKTAWAKWLAEQAGLDVLLCKGSDLLGKYVGETEERIAQAFQRAQERQLALIIDEADSFLFQRQSAERHWERSMVNEMLTQIESFDGLLIISTNLMGELDPAVLRRFDLKIRFDWLTPEQTAALAAEQLRLLGLPALNAAQQGSLKKLDNAAPGDFAAIARRHRFALFADSQSWLDALARECSLKQPNGGKRSIGFC